mgnify:CR=1 FL=1|tara:strand:- start:103 stop:480 length:378 start_codon:yes stop_codon:yes gene_type:complete
MSKKVNSSDKINDTTLHEILLMMDARLKHIEDIEADNRDIIIKLVKQSNQIVRFLKQIEIEDVTDDFEDISSPPMTESEKIRSNKMQELKELVDEFMDKEQDLQEFEEELEKHKDKLTPGQIGES